MIGARPKDAIWKDLRAHIAAGGARPALVAAAHRVVADSFGADLPPRQRGPRDPRHPTTPHRARPDHRSRRAVGALRIVDPGRRARVPGAAPSAGRRSRGSRHLGSTGRGRVPAGRSYPLPARSELPRRRRARVAAQAERTGVRRGPPGRPVRTGHGQSAAGVPAQRGRGARRHRRATRDLGPGADAPARRRPEPRPRARGRGAAAFAASDRRRCGRDRSRAAGPSRRPVDGTGRAGTGRDRLRDGGGVAR